MACHTGRAGEFSRVTETPSGEGCPADKGVLGSGVRGGARAGNAFWRISKGTFTARPRFDGRLMSLADIKYSESKRHKCLLNNLPVTDASFVSVWLMENLTWVSVSLRSPQCSIERTINVNMAC